jgi:tetratricopeptide (TPR) repeat protein
MSCVNVGKILTTVIIGLSVLSGCQSSEQRAVDREKFGIELFEKGEYFKAKLEFNSALKEDGTLSTSYYYLAMINEKNNNFIAMKQNLIRAVKLGPENIDARIKLGNAYLLFNDLSAALIEADEILQRPEENHNASALKAAVFIKQKKQGEALAILDDILKKQPDFIEAISLKALIFMQNDKFDSALSLVSPAIDSGIDDISLHMLKIQLDAKRNNIAAVIADYERLTKLYPKNIEFKFALAKVYFQSNKKQEAEKLLRDVVNSNPSEIQPKIVLLELLKNISKEKVVEQVKIDNATNKNKPEILLKLSEWLMANRYFSEATSLLVNIENNESSDALKQQAKLILAMIAFHNNELDKSNVILDELIVINSENLQAKLLKAKIHVALEEYDEALTLLKKVLWGNPNSDEALVLIAQIELIKGNPVKADNKFREALDINPVNMTALLPVINRALRNKDIDFASDLITKAIKIQPNNLALQKEAVEIKIISRDWDGANEILAVHEKQPQGRVPAKFLKARVFLKQGECTQAISGFKEVLQLAPNFPDALRQMATCYEKTQQRSEMLSYMQTFLASNPKNISAYLILGKIYLLNNKVEQAITIYNQALAINKQHPQIYAALAKAYKQQDDDKKAIETYKQGLVETPNNARLSIYLASSYEKIKEYENAAAVYESLLTADPKLEIAINNYAALLVDGIGDNNSIEKAHQLVANFRNSENPFYLDSFAWVELKLGNVKNAVPLLEKVNNMADVPVFKYHLGVAYHEQGNDAGAVAQLSQAVGTGKKKGDFAELERAQKLLNELSVAKKF